MTLIKEFGKILRVNTMTFWHQCIQSVETEPRGGEGDGRMRHTPHGHTTRVPQAPRKELFGFGFFFLLTFSIRFQLGSLISNGLQILFRRNGVSADYANRGSGIELAEGCRDTIQE